ncbi:MAG: hypothetical protein ABWZ25_18035 [Chitinophagaceae bacterium]
MNLLFVCSRNKWRSPTAEKIFRSGQHNTRSAGTSESAKVKVHLGLVQWADIIFVMEREHRTRLIERFGNDLRNRAIIVLDIPDEYEYMDEELIEILKLSVGPFLQNS